MKHFDSRSVSTRSGKHMSIWVRVPIPASSLTSRSDRICIVILFAQKPQVNAARPTTCGKDRPPHRVTTSLTLFQLCVDSLTCYGQNLRSVLRWDLRELVIYSYTVTILEQDPPCLGWGGIRRHHLSHEHYRQRQYPQMWKTLQSLWYEWDRRWNPLFVSLFQVFNN